MLIQLYSNKSFKSKNKMWITINNVGKKLQFVNNWVTLKI